MKAQALPRSARDWGSPTSLLQVGIKAETAPSGGAFAEVILGTVDRREKGAGDSRDWLALAVGQGEEPVS